MKSAIQFGYDIAQDRLVVTLASEAGQQRFWWTRRQCIALVVALRRVQGEAATLNTASGAATAPASHNRSAESHWEAGTAALAEPPTLCRVAIRESAQGLRLSLQPVPKAVGASKSLILRPAEQLLLCRTLGHLAMRAHWDLDAAEARAAANAALKKAQRLH